MLPGSAKVWSLFFFSFLVTFLNRKYCERGMARNDFRRLDRGRFVLCIRIQLCLSTSQGDATTDLKIRSNFGFFAPQGRHNKSVQMKFEMKAYIMILLRTKFGYDRSRAVGTEAPQSLVKFAVFRPAEATPMHQSDNRGKIWHGGSHHRSPMSRQIWPYRRRGAEAPK